MIEQIFNEAYDLRKPTGNADLSIVTKKKKKCYASRP